MFITVLGPRVSILIESSSGPSMIQILTYQCLKCAVGSQTLIFLIQLCIKCMYRYVLLYNRDTYF